MVGIIMDKIEFLSKVELLSELNIQELKELAEDFQWETFAQGTNIIELGEKLHRFYVLTEGKAEAVVDKNGLNALAMTSFGPGDSFGEMALFTGKPAPMAVRCVEDCTVLVLDGEHFAHMLVRWPKLYEAFIEKLSHSLTKVNLGLWEARHKEFLRSGLRLNQLKYKFYDIWGSPKTTKEIENKLKELAQTREHVLLIGERGTGQQMMAWYIHKDQFGEKAPFIVMDGRELDQQWGDLAFETHHNDEGQSLQGSGLLEIAEGGTLFIRDINVISPRAQLKLASVLASGEVNCRVIGSLLDEPEQLPVRLLPSLLDQFTQRYQFTPLRERKRDIPFLAKGILERLAQINNRKVPSLDNEATRLLLSYNYRQGNTSELIKIIERAFYLAEGDIIRQENVFFGPAAEKTERTFNLLSLGWVRSLIEKGIFPRMVQRFIFAGFFATVIMLIWQPTPELTSLAMALSWKIWWPAMVISAFIFGRLWCGICPFSYGMALMQKVIHLNRPVPEVIKKYDYLFVTFLFVLIFWLEVVLGLRQNPVFTGLWVIIITLAAALVGIVFVRHTWCRHLCPLGGFVGMASINSMLEVRSDTDICLNKCTTHECYKGSDKEEGCPMSQFAPFLDNNINCKLCMRCVRNCPNNSIRVNLRPPAREIWHLLRVNQGFAIFIGVALSILIPITYFEPFHQLWPRDQWLLWFSLTYWSTALIAGILTWLIAQPFRTKGASIRVKLVFAFIPMVVAGYIAYQLHFAPGAKTLLLGFAYPISGNLPEYFFVPALKVGQIIGAFLGLTLTTVAVVMVFLNRKKSKA